MQQPGPRATLAAAAPGNIQSGRGGSTELIVDGEEDEEDETDAEDEEDLAVAKEMKRLTDPTSMYSHGPAAVDQSSSPAASTTATVVSGHPGSVAAGGTYITIANGGNNTLSTKHPDLNDGQAASDEVEDGDAGENEYLHIVAGLRSGAFAAGDANTVVVLEHVVDEVGGASTAVEPGC